MRMRFTSIVLLGAAVLLAISIISCSHRRSTAPSPPPAMAQRWGLIGGDKCELVVRSTGEAKGSRGLSVEYDANPDQQLVLQFDAKVHTGTWTVRVDDGERAPNWLPLAGYPALRLTGSKRYRFMIYSDDVGSAILINDLAIRPATDTDDGLPLVWPTSGTLLEEDRQRQSKRWSDGWMVLLGIQADEGVMVKARAITSFVYQRSNIKGPPERTFSHFGGAHDWDVSPPPTVDGLCGAFATAVLDLCGKLGIAARRVSLASQRFAEGEAIDETHELVEVFEPTRGHWVLFDPTFNLTFEGPEGRPLGLKDLLDAAARGQHWRAVPIGALRPGRTTADYYLKYEDLLWMGSVPAVPNMGESGAAFCSRGLPVSEVFRAKYPAPVSP